MIDLSVAACRFAPCKYYNRCFICRLLDVLIVAIVVNIDLRTEMELGSQQGKQIDDGYAAKVAKPCDIVYDEIALIPAAISILFSYSR